MATELIYNQSDKPVQISYDGRTVLVQPKGNGRWEFRRFGIVDEEASKADIEAGLCFEDPSSLKQHAVVPADKYPVKRHRLVQYGEGEQAVKKRLPQYCQLAVRVSDEPQDGCTEVSTTLAAYACTDSFERKSGVKLVRGGEITRAFREREKDRQAYIEKLEAELAAAKKPAPKTEKAKDQ